MAVENKKDEKDVKKQNKANIFKRAAVGISNLVRGFKAEIKRIVWPSKEDVKKVSSAVLVICTAYVIYVGVLDSAFQYLFKLLFNK